MSVHHSAPLRGCPGREGLPADPAARGTAISLFAFALFLGSALGTALLARLLASSGYDPSCWSAASRRSSSQPSRRATVRNRALQADAYVTLDVELARRLEGIVPTATIAALRTP